MPQGATILKLVTSQAGAAAAAAGKPATVLGAGTAASVATSPQPQLQVCTSSNSSSISSFLNSHWKQIHAVNFGYFASALYIIYVPHVGAGA